MLQIITGGQEKVYNPSLRDAAKKVPALMAMTLRGEG